MAEQLQLAKNKKQLARKKMNQFKQKNPHKFVLIGQRLKYI